MRKHTSLVFTLAASAIFATCAPAQRISVGVMGGVSVTSSAISGDESKPYAVGASIEVRLPANFALEGDVIYQRTGSYSIYTDVIYTAYSPTIGSVNQVGSYSQRLRGNYWQSPVMAKYYFRPGGSFWRPFAGAGCALGKTWFHTDAHGTYLDSTGTLQSLSSTSDYRSALNVGAVFSGGVRFQAGRIGIVPEARFTRWGGTDESTTRKNQAAFFLGIQF